MFDRCELWQNHVAPGSYPDCDMLPLGKLGGGFGNGERDTRFTRDEQITMMTLWSVFGSPLMAGAELTKLDEWTLWLLTRKEILKLVSNEYVGRQFEKNEEYAIWSCRKEGERYLAFFNFMEEARQVSCLLEEVEQFAGRTSGISRAVELWSGRDIAPAGGVLTDLVPAHGARLFELLDS